jgi:U3 small nucleolar RNA-associated protein 24
MGVQKKTRKFAAVKRVISQRDARIKKNIMANDAKQKEKEKTKAGELIREVYVHHHTP